MERSKRARRALQELEMHMEIRNDELELIHRGIWLRGEINELITVLRKRVRSYTFHAACGALRPQEDKSVFTRVFTDAAMTGEPIIIVAFTNSEFMRTICSSEDRVARSSRLAEYVLLLNTGEPAMHLAFEALGEVIHEKGVEELDLSNISMFDETLCGLSDVLCYGPLKRLNLQHKNFDARTYECVSRALRSKESCLETLELRGCDIDDFVIEGFMVGLRTNTTLKTLDLGNNVIQDVGMEMIGEMLHINQTLENLRLGNNPARAAVTLVALTDGLRHNHTLKQLRFSIGGPVDMLAVRSFADMIGRHGTLTSLTFYWLPMNSTMPTKVREVTLAALEHNHTLLDFSLRPFGVELCRPVIHRNRMAFLYLHNLQRAAAMMMHGQPDRWRKPQDWVEERRLRAQRKWKKTCKWKEEVMTPAVIALLDETEAYRHYR